jgi:hypothetical protein
MYSLQIYSFHKRIGLRRQNIIGFRVKGELLNSYYLSDGDNPEPTTKCISGDELGIEVPNRCRDPACVAVKQQTHNSDSKAVVHPSYPLQTAQIGPTRELDDGGGYYPPRAIIRQASTRLPVFHLSVATEFAPYLSLSFRLV